MKTAELLDKEVKRIGGDRGDEIIGALKALAEIDVKLKDSLDEIERLDEEMVKKHNELADRINDLVRQVTGEDGSDDTDETVDSINGSGRDHDIKVKVEIHIINLTL